MAGFLVNFASRAFRLCKLRAFGSILQNLQTYQTTFHKITRKTYKLITHPLLGDSLKPTKK